MAGIEEEDNIFAEEIALLESMFGATVSTPVIASVLESCNGNVNLAAEAIIKITPDMQLFQPKEAATENIEEYAEIQVQETPSEPTTRQQPQIIASPISQEIQALSASFSEALCNTGAIPKPPPDTRNPIQNYGINVWPEPIAKILEYHNQGTRTLILMRGAAGSGKTHMARHIVDYTVGPLSQNYAKHIFSTDNYFLRGNKYLFNRNRLDEAHTMNQKLVCDAANKGVSPIIVDNTNIEIWEMEPYTRDGIRNGYVIEIVEPNTSWAKNVYQLSKKNIHGVPRETIRRQLDRYDKKVTTDLLLKTLRLAYPANKKPPVKRNIPTISPPESPRKKVETVSLTKVKYDKDHSCSAAGSNVEIFHHDSPDSPDELLPAVEINEAACMSERLDKAPSNDGELINPEHALKLQKIIEAQQKFELFQEVEKEWDNGERWDAPKHSGTASEDLAIALVPKPARESEKKYNDNLIESTNICDDWSKISMFMPSWHDAKVSNCATSVEIPRQVHTNSVATCFEVGDLNEDIHKVLYSNPRNINETIPEADIEIKRPKIPQVVMLDKSTSTHENNCLTETQECKHKERHFSALKRMFKVVPHHILRDIFDSCNSDVNWAVDLVLDSYPESQENMDKNDYESDSDEEPIEECNCLAAYNIIPNMVPIAPISPPVPETISSSLSSQKKPKREIKLSDSSLQLKRQIESNVIISDNHYSQHYLNMRRRRETNYDGLAKASGSGLLTTQTQDVTDPNASLLDVVDNHTATALLEANTYDNSNDIRNMPSTSHYDFQFMDPNDSDTESDSNKSEHFESVTINLGTEFITKLDKLFGREEFQYPANIQPIVNLPMSILQQINAHWAMSVAFQMDDGSKQSEEMIKQDEDFARQLADKEKKMSEEGKEPDVPSLKEIMDMELAYSIYERNVAEWRNNEPQDLAARLSREKLYNLFPDLAKEVLSEMLMAHDYNFKNTIESLLISTGQSNWLEDEKGIEKFVMEKEMERKEKFLDEQNKNLSEAEWPNLIDPKPINLDTVNYYRDEAEKYLQYRNANFEKARQYFARNSPHAASFYSDIAALHTKKYEQSSCLAAAYLMKYHLKNNPDKDVLDLHFLRVAEAMVNLDIFLDQIILQIRNKNINFKEVWIITGKGQHSIGGPRIKPATKRRLKAREIQSKAVNGGLLMAQLHPSHKMTNELAQLENS